MTNFIISIFCFPQILMIDAENKNTICVYLRPERQRTGEANLREE